RITARTPSSEIDVTQGSTDRRATGVFRFRDAEKNVTIEAVELGVVQVTDRWATFSGRARVSSSGVELPVRVIVDQDDPRQPAAGVASVRAEGLGEISVRLDPDTATITSSARK